MFSSIDIIFILAINIFLTALNIPLRHMIGISLGIGLGTILWEGIIVPYLRNNSKKKK